MRIVKRRARKRRQRLRSLLPATPQPQYPPSPTPPPPCRAQPTRNTALSLRAATLEGGRRRRRLGIRGRLQAMPPTRIRIRSRIRMRMRPALPRHPIPEKAILVSWIGCISSAHRHRMHTSHTEPAWRMGEGEWSTVVVEYGRLLLPLCCRDGSPMLLAPLTPNTRLSRATRLRCTRWRASSDLGHATSRRRRRDPLSLKSRRAVRAAEQAACTRSHPSP